MVYTHIYIYIYIFCGSHRRHSRPHPETSHPKLFGDTWLYQNLVMMIWNRFTYFVSTLKYGICKSDLTLIVWWWISVKISISKTYEHLRLWRSYAPSSLTLHLNESKEPIFLARFNCIKTWISDFFPYYSLRFIAHASVNCWNLAVDYQLRDTE